MEWKEVRLGEVCSISSSKRIFASEYKNEGIPFYRGKEIIEKQKGNNISTELFISHERYIEIKSKFGVPQKGELLLTSVGTLGIPYVVKDEEFYFKDGNLTWFRNFDGLNSLYLYYWFLSPEGRHEIDTKAIGSTQKALTIDALSKFCVKLPNIKTQEQIINILSSLDAKIENNNKINANLEAQAAALFKSWFVDFEPFKDGEFVESELVMIPKGWKVGTLSEFIEVKYGKDHKKLADGDIPVYGSGGLMRKVENFLYDGESVLIPRKGTLNNVLYVDEKFWSVDSMFYTIMKIPNVALFVYQFLVTKDLASMNAGSAVPSMTTDILNKMSVIIPPVEILESFNKIVKCLYEKIHHNDKENQSLSSLRDTLLPKLMSGEIELPDDDVLKFCKYYKGELENPYQSGTLPYFYWREEANFFNHVYNDPSVYKHWEEITENCGKEAFCIPMDVFNSLPKPTQVMIVMATWQAWNMQPWGGDKYLKHYGKSVEELLEIKELN